jgi:F-type H+-transporting ATPase subunit gamma
MKSLAAASIGQYEKSVQALAGYYRTVELGLAACFREIRSLEAIPPGKSPAARGAIGAIVFGSDQGLVGQFNETIADFALQALQALGAKPGTLEVWAVGERVHSLLAESGLPMAGLFTVPTSVAAIVPLVGRIQIESESKLGSDDTSSIFVFHNRPQASGLYQPVSQRLLPLDIEWQRSLAEIEWPAVRLPQILVGAGPTLRSLVREYLFISFYRACAESLASENESRLSAMERAEKNIGDLLEQLKRSFNQLRQSGIDEELFDVISGFEALSGSF